MKRLAIALICTAGAVATQAATFFDNAHVRSVEPQYENVTVPHEQCRAEWVTEPQRVSSGGPNYGGVVVGALAGGVLGNQVGKGTGRAAATALGAVAGALVGDRVAGRDRHEPEPAVQRQVTRCETVNEVQPRLTGYRVAYDYRGQTYTTVMDHDPGRNLQVRVSVDPVVR
ncbi:MAG: glycine zipper 2TM domain-containing protein [Ramlibacter sp.]|nr:glycine zipper 2TM domain-containing protein [Ramlibacter sp.]